MDIECQNCKEREYLFKEIIKQHSDYINFKGLMDVELKKIKNLQRLCRGRWKEYRKKWDSKWKTLISKVSQNKEQEIEIKVEEEIDNPRIIEIIIESDQSTKQSTKQSKQETKKFTCPNCQKTFNRRYNMQRHYSRLHI